MSWMFTAAVIVGLALLTLDIWVSRLVLHTDSVLAGRRAPWLMVVWLLPLLGAALALLVLRETAPAQERRQGLSGSESTYPPGIGDIGSNAGDSTHDS
jgi:H+/Cl- antiporter ClcA